jgi:hypothetical protein
MPPKEKKLLGLRSGLSAKGRAEYLRPNTPLSGCYRAASQTQGQPDRFFRLFSLFFLFHAARGADSYNCPPQNLRNKSLTPKDFLETTINFLISFS